MSAPEETLRVLQAAAVTHVVGLPDNTSAPLFDALVAHPTVRLVTVSREGEAFAIAAGLWLGGARPLIVIQNTGLLESGDSLRGTAMRMRAPVPVLITGRGYARMARAGLGPETPRNAELMARADVDGTALLTEPTLSAWGVPFARCDEGCDPAEALARLIAETRARECPMALVLARALT